jgi:hypothetical protein
MTEACRRLVVGALFALFLAAAAHGDADGARYLGRPVVDILLELREPGTGSQPPRPASNSKACD